jgi:c(7)-type cytochrome triheme protein
MTRFHAVAALALVGWAAADDGPGKRARALPQDYGRVVLANHAARSKTPPVAFDHWLHRAKFTCRVCHVDVGFAMKAGGTDVRAVDNASGVYCGACHNGRLRVDGAAVFAACRTRERPDGPACARCHSAPDVNNRHFEFASFTKGFPKGRFGNGIDWEEAERKGVIKPLDVVEGVSLRRPKMGVQKDFALAPKLPGMPEIIFSHAKHTVWTGCEGCHPEIFTLRKGGTKITMVEIFEGKYCGACHVSVAFPTTDCQRCHATPVQ